MLVNMVSTDITKWIAWGRVVVKEMHGWNAGASDLYIQFHQTPPTTGGGSTAGTQLATGTVPACKSFLAQANNGFMYSFGSQGIELSELLVAISSTEANYTAAASALDLTLDVDSQFACDGTEHVVGDLTTGQNALQIWSEATGAAALTRLLRVDVKDNQNTDQLVCLIYAVDTVSFASPRSIVASFFVCKKNSTTTTYFGDTQGGFTPYQQDANYTSHRGCTINITNEVNGYWTFDTVYGGTAPNIRAIYK